MDPLLTELAKPAFVAAITADEYGARRDGNTMALRAVDARRNELAGMWADNELSYE